MATLGELSAALEVGTDEYTDALDGEAEAENAYLRAFAAFFLRAKVDGVPATIMSKYADAQAVEEKAAWNLAVARVKRCYAKRDEIKSRLMARMSHDKNVRDHT